MESIADCDLRNGHVIIVLICRLYFLKNALGAILLQQIV